MNKLIISTKHPATVAALLREHQLVEHAIIAGRDIPQVAASPGTPLEINYPDDAISQSLFFWFALAKGCGLIEWYRLINPQREKVLTEMTQLAQEMGEYD